jgi:hypothetical protein
MHVDQHPADPGAAPSRAAPRSRRWIWFFAALIVLGAAAISINWVYSVWQQLRPDRLAASRALWKEHGPASYDLEYVVKEENTPGGAAGDDARIDYYKVQVRGGQARSATRNDVPLSPDEAMRHDVNALFDLIQKHLESDGGPGQPRTYAHAHFDDADGHPVHYVRRVMGSRQRLEITIQLQPAD